MLFLSRICIKRTRVAGPIITSESPPVLAEKLSSPIKSTSAHWRRSWRWPRLALKRGWKESKPRNLVHYRQWGGPVANFLIFCFISTCCYRFFKIATKLQTEADRRLCEISAGRGGRKGWGICPLLIMRRSFIKQGWRHEGIGVHY